MERLPTDNVPVLRHKHGDLTLEGWSRGAQASYWRLPEMDLAFDCGAVPAGFESVSRWAISHAHSDHLAGLVGLLGSRSMAGRTPPTIFVPRASRDGVARLIDAWRAVEDSSLPCELVGLEPGDVVDLGKDRALECFATRHTVPSLGYVLASVRQKLKPEYAALDGETLRRLRDGGAVLSDTVRVPLVAYAGDTAPHALHDAPSALRAKILIIEATFLGGSRTPAEAHALGHTHMEDLAALAPRIESELLIVSHVSLRHTADEARAALEATLPPELMRRTLLWA